MKKLYKEKRNTFQNRNPIRDTCSILNTRRRNCGKECKIHIKIAIYCECVLLIQY